MAQPKDRRNGGEHLRTGFTASCFDLFHAGHIMMLREAKRQCEYLIVGLQTDPTIDRPTKNKPVQSVVERFIQLEACKYVDEIVVYATEKDLRDILLSHPIDVRILGDEYKDKEFTGHDIDMEFYFNTRRHSFSTSELRQRVVELEKLKLPVESTKSNRQRVADSLLPTAAD